MNLNSTVYDRCIGAVVFRFQGNNEMKWSDLIGRYDNNRNNRYIVQRTIDTLFREQNK